MGDIADGIINGDFDFYTGEYIGYRAGFPRILSVCGNSFGHNKGKKHKNQKKKVRGYLRSSGYTDFKQQNEIISQYKQSCKNISETHWEDFKIYIKNIKQHEHQQL